MKRIEIPRRPGHELDTDADDCLAYVSWALPSRKAKHLRGPALNFLLPFLIYHLPGR
jgi:hypothetical protein